jgi:hypothetical protein
MVAMRAGCPKAELVLSREDTGGAIGPDLDPGRRAALSSSKGLEM